MKALYVGETESDNSSHQGLPGHSVFAPLAAVPRLRLGSHWLWQLSLVLLIIMTNPLLDAEMLLECQLPAICSEQKVQEGPVGDTDFFFLMIVIKACLNVFFKTILQF